jgi:hypothetical protein
MGYRYYFYKVKKTDVEKVKYLSLEQLKEQFVEDDDCMWIRNIIDHTQIFEFGKLYWDDTVEQINATGERLFNDRNVVEYFADNDFHIVGKNGVLKAIEIYANKVKEYYKSMVNENKRIVPRFGYDIAPDDIKVNKVRGWLEQKIQEWEHHEYYITNLNEKDKYTVANSREYELKVFNLIHILKVMDWETETILFYGW